MARNMAGSSVMILFGAIRAGEPGYDVFSGSVEGRGDEGEDVFSHHISQSRQRTQDTSSLARCI